MLFLEALSGMKMSDKNTAAQVWARQYLLDRGMAGQLSEPEIVISAPWSEVVRFHTDKGAIYLKTTPERLALEAPIIEVMQSEYACHVPTLIGVNAPLHSFLMEDAGVRLRSLLKSNFDTSLASQGIQLFTQWQMDVAHHISPLLNLGVPDWRLENMPSIFEGFLRNKNFWEAIAIDEELHHSLMAVVPAIQALCEKLQSYNIPPSFVQPDCNDNNLLIDPTTQRITLIDVGEIVISHPLFSVVNYLYVLEKHHRVSFSEAVYTAIRTSALEAFLVREKEDRLVDALSIVTQLWPVYWALSQYRLVQACGSVLINNGYVAKLIYTLETLLQNMRC